MSFDSLLVHTCTTKRYTYTAHDDGGQPIKVWANKLVNQPCRFGPDTGRPVMVGTQAVICDYLVDIGNVDVTEEDLVIRDDTGEYYKILFCSHAADSTKTHHHKVLRVQLIRPRSSDIPFTGPT